MQITAIVPRSLGGESCGDTVELSPLIQVDLDNEDTALVTEREVRELDYQPVH